MNMLKATLGHLIHEAAQAQRIGNLPGVADAYRNVLLLQPDFAEVWVNLAVALLSLRELDEAAAANRRAIELKPHLPEPYVNLSVVLLLQGRVDESIAILRRAIQRWPRDNTARQNLLFTLNHVPDHDRDALFAEHAAWGRDQEPATPPAPHTNDRSPSCRLRIGYVSPDFRNHVVPRFLEPVLRHHDRQQVDLYAYAESVLTPDIVTIRLQEFFSEWRNTFGLPATDVAAQVRADQIDILVDLAGHTGGNRLDVFALKPAPIQMTWIGYPNTTGLRAMDYRITDWVLNPDVNDQPGQPVRDTEKPLRLPGVMAVTIAPPDNVPAVGPLPAGGTGHLTFGSPHNLAKLNHRVYDVWAAILKRLPGSRLVFVRDTLTGSAAANVLQQFAMRDIAPWRIDIRPVCGPAYFAAYRDIDIVLDTFPYTGGTTTYDALWMGCPVITLAGERPAERSSATILYHAGLSDWITTTIEGYVACAVRAARELEQLEQLAILRGGLRAGLRDRLMETVSNAERFTRVLEAAYREVWERWCRLPPGQAGG